LDDRQNWNRLLPTGIKLVDRLVCLFLYNLSCPYWLFSCLRRNVGNVHWHVRTVDVDKLECVVGNDSCGRDLLVCGWVCFFRRTTLIRYGHRCVVDAWLCSGAFGLTSEVFIVRVSLYIVIDVAWMRERWEDPLVGVVDVLLITNESFFYFFVRVCVNLAVDSCTFPLYIEWILFLTFHFLMLMITI